MAIVYKLLYVITVLLCLYSGIGSYNVLLTNERISEYYENKSVLDSIKVEREIPFGNTKIFCHTMFDIKVTEENLQLQRSFPIIYKISAELAKIISVSCFCYIGLLIKLLYEFLFKKANHFDSRKIFPFFILGILLGVLSYFLFVASPGFFLNNDLKEYKAFFFPLIGLISGFLIEKFIAKLTTKFLPV